MGPGLTEHVTCTRSGPTASWGSDASEAENQTGATCTFQMLKQKLSGEELG